MPALEKVSANKAFGGQLTKYKFDVRHESCPALGARVITRLGQDRGQAVGGY